MTDTRPAAEPRALVLARRTAAGKALTAEEGAALLADIEQLRARADHVAPAPAATTKET